MADMLVIDTDSKISEKAKQYFTIIANLTYNEYKVSMPNETKAPLALSFRDSDVKGALSYATANSVVVDIPIRLPNVVEAQAVNDEISHELAHALVERATGSRLLNNNLVHYASNNRDIYRNSIDVYYATLRKLTKRVSEKIYVYDIKRLIHSAPVIQHIIATDKPKGRHPYWYDF